LIDCLLAACLLACLLAYLVHTLLAENQRSRGRYQNDFDERDLLLLDHRVNFHLVAVPFQQSLWTT